MLLSWKSCLLAQLLSIGMCSPWSGQESDRHAAFTMSRVSPSELLQSGTQRSLVYQMALDELQQLESEPLCHRVAARLLIHNCQLLDGKDDTSVLLDGGRQARDFVDSYAASLAICDLERGSFQIPAACEAFREPVLSRLPLGDSAAGLHVSPAQIKACLTGLGDSASAWNTWVSYSHKAVRFCEAARADHDKTHNILLFQRLTRVMAKLTDDVEADMQRRTEAWDLEAERTSDKLGYMESQADHLWQQLGEIGTYVEGALDPALRTAGSSAREGLETAETLQHLLASMLKSMLDSSAEVAYAHEQSLEHVAQRLNSDMDVIQTSVGALLSASVSLQNELEHSRRHAENLSVQQDSLEQGLVKLVNLQSTLYSQYDDHARLLVEASNMTSDILDTLSLTATSATQIHGSFAAGNAYSGWWPYFVCPVGSLVMGSYGLPPSAVRNVGLVALGELLGFVLSSRSLATYVARLTGNTN